MGKTVPVRLDGVEVTATTVPLNGVTIGAVARNAHGKWVGLLRNDRGRYVPLTRRQQPECDAPHHAREAVLNNHPW